MQKYSGERCPHRLSDALPVTFRGTVLGNLPVRHDLILCHSLEELPRELLKGTKAWMVACLSQSHSIKSIETMKNAEKVMNKKFNGAENSTLRNWRRKFRTLILATLRLQPRDNHLQREAKHQPQII
jgi:hypothetical protein